jgi:transketolase
MADHAGFESETFVLPSPPESSLRPVTLARQMADAVRAFVVEAGDSAQAERPALPLAMADVATVLWTRFHKFDAADPHWPDRDRFILSAGDGYLLLHALIALTDPTGLSTDDVADARQWRCVAADAAVLASHPSVEAIPGPLGQGIATAVGLALAERNMAARFGRSLVDHRTWVIASAGDLLEGISHEAAVLAGQLGLAKLAVLYDATCLARGGDDPVKRFATYGWATKQVDAQDSAQINAALSFAMRSKKPTLIACVGAEADWSHPVYDIDQESLDRWQGIGSRGATSRRSWLKRLARHSQQADFERVLAGRLPDNWREALALLKQEVADTRPKQASGVSSQNCLEVLAPVIPELVGASVDLSGSNPFLVRGMTSLTSDNYGGRTILYGGREHGLAAIANGLVLHGGIIPCVGAVSVFSDSLRPALRMAAIMRQRVIYVLTRDSLGFGQDGPAHQPVEHLPSLRAMPNVQVLRPADPTETAECWELALRRSDGPSVLLLSRQNLPTWRTDGSENRCARGGYVLAEAEGPRKATLIASGAEIPVAMAARDRLTGEGIVAAVVSLPSWELFAAQDERYRAETLGGAPRFGIEAASGFGWERWLGADGVFIGMTDYNVSGEHDDLHAQFGLTPEAVAAAVVRKLGTAD